MPGASAHFSRFKVTEIALSEQALGQFDDSKYREESEVFYTVKSNPDLQAPAIEKFEHAGAPPLQARIHSA